MNRILYRGVVLAGVMMLWVASAQAALPVVTNAAPVSASATNITFNGNLTSDGGEATTVYVYWGTTDGVEVKANWDYCLTNGVLSVGAFSTVTNGLLYGVQYYFRCYATNATGEDWANATTNFVTASPASGPISSQLGILDLTANSGNNPATGLPWRSGDTYRFAFSSSIVYPVDITSADTIATYNNWIQGLADASSLNIGTAQGLTWKALVSTPTVNARDNTDTNPNEDGDGESIFLLNGTTRIVDDYVEFWNVGGINASQPAINKDEDAGPVNNTDPTPYSSYGAAAAWTGSKNDGTANAALATDANVTFGGAAWSDYNHWINRSSDDPSTALALMYGLSEPLTVQGNVFIYNVDEAPLSWTKAELVGRLAATSAVCYVNVYWSTTDNADSAAWLADGTALNTAVGVYTNANALVITQSVASLTSGTTYYFAYMATNASTNIWSSPNGSVTTLDSQYWDGGTADIAGNGDGVSDGTAGTWDLVTKNWDLGVDPYAAWADGASSKVIFDGSAGTVTLAQDVTIGDLTMSGVLSGNKYTIQSSTLNFSGGAITVNSSQGGNWITVATFESGISGSPDVVLNMNGNTQTEFAPTSDTMTLDDVSGGGLIELGGTTTGNSVDAVVGKMRFNGTGEWTLTGLASAYEHFIDSSDVVVSTGTLRSNNRAVKLSGGTLHYNNPGAVFNDTSGAPGNDDTGDTLSMRGGSLDNTSGSPITTSTYNPRMSFGTDWTFVGSLGANSDLNYGAGAVSMFSGDRQITVANAAATLSINGVISGDGYSLSKAGPGTLELGGANAYSGDTFVDAGTLKLSGGSAIADASSCWVASGASVDVAADETVAGLYLDGEQAYAGTWGSSSSGAMFQNDTYFSGTGKLTVSAGTEVVVTEPATGQTTVDATWHGTLRAPDIDWDLYVHWGTTDGGTDAGSWDGVVFLGNWASTDSAAITFVTNSLAPDTTYYYTFQASNAVTNVWASPSTVFGTLGPPIVTTNVGPSNLGQWTADLNGVLTSGGTALVYVCWGESDAGTATTSNWENVVGIPSGSQLIPFSVTATGLLYGISYDYRVYATNGFGSDWSEVATFGPAFPEYFGLPVTANLEVHYDADLGVVTNVSGEVTNWADQSGNDHHATTGGGAAVVLSAALNDLPAIQFDKNEYLNVNDTFYVRDQFAVGRSRNVSWNNYGAFLDDRSSRDYGYLWENNNKGFHSNKKPDGVSKNGDIVSPIDADCLSPIDQYMILRIDMRNVSAGDRNHYINRSDHSAAAMEICEIIGYGAELSVADQNQVGGYLAWKYGISTTYPTLSVPASLGVTNLSLFNVGNSSLDLSGTLNATQSVFTVRAYWSLIDNADGAAWLADGTASSFLIGTYTNVDAEALAASINGITRGTNYFNMRAYNEVTNIWISANQSVWLDGLAEGTTLQFR